MDLGLGEAMSVPAFRRRLVVLSGAIASLPFIIYRRVRAATSWLRSTRSIRCCTMWRTGGNRGRDSIAAIFVFLNLLEYKAKRPGRLLLADAAQDANLMQAAVCMNINGAGTLNGFGFF
jgi:hypothetical protein